MSCLAGFEVLTKNDLSPVWDITWKNYLTVDTQIVHYLRDILECKDEGPDDDNILIECDMAAFAMLLHHLSNTLDEKYWQDNDYLLPYDIPTAQKTWSTIFDKWGEFLNNYFWTRTDLVVRFFECN